MLEARARQLGLIKPGERAFLVRGDLDPAAGAARSAAMTAAPSAGSPAGSDRRALAALLGREPFTDFRVVVRCPHGGPAVVRNAPVDLRGRPFPTRDWLACRALAEAVSRLEASGGVRALEADEGMARAPGAGATPAPGAARGPPGGGLRRPGHVKCLHAHLAFAMGEGGSPVGDWILARAPHRLAGALLRGRRLAGGR